MGGTACHDVPQSEVAKGLAERRAGLSLFHGWKEMRKVRQQ